MSKTELAILGLLSERPMHGYEIKQTIKDRWMDMWANIGLPSIYKTLSRLSENNSVIENKEKIGKTPERNVYSISDSGKECLVKLVLKGLQSTKPHELPFWLAFAFLENADNDTLLQALENRRTYLENSRRNLSEKREQIKDRIPYQWLTLMENGLDIMQLETTKIEKIIDHYRVKSSVHT